MGVNTNYNSNNITSDKQPVMKQQQGARGVDSWSLKQLVVMQQQVPKQQATK
jgi:hypothetical protein